jgi:hypothetical protein
MFPKFRTTHAYQNNLQINHNNTQQQRCNRFYKLLKAEVETIRFLGTSNWRKSRNNTLKNDNLTYFEITFFNDAERYVCQFFPTSVITKDKTAAIPWYPLGIQMCATHFYGFKPVAMPETTSKFHPPTFNVYFHS